MKEGEATWRSATSAAGLAGAAVVAAILAEEAVAARLPQEAEQQEPGTGSVAAPAAEAEALAEAAWRLAVAAEPLTRRAEVVAAAVA
jgi:hypothetical protein